MPGTTSRISVCTLIAVLCLLAGCRSSGRSADAAEAGMSLYERRLLRVIEDKEALETFALETDLAERPEVERRFRRVAGDFNSIIADNPDRIEARLIYAKMLDFFGDEVGARDEFAAVLNRDPTVAVAHQQLGTYFAEEGDYAKALAYYLNAVQHDPNEPVYHYGVGDLLHTFGPELIEEGALTQELLDKQMLEAFRQAAALASGDLVYQFRYGEAHYDVHEPDWSEALTHWRWLALRDDLDDLGRQAVALHEARCLGELGRYEEARERAMSVTEPGLETSRKALLVAIEEAKAREEES